MVVSVQEQRQRSTEIEKAAHYASGKKSTQGIRLVHRKTGLYHVFVETYFPARP